MTTEYILASMLCSLILLSLVIYIIYLVDKKTFRVYTRHYIHKITRSFIFNIIAFILWFPFLMIYHIYYYWTDIFLDREKRLKKLLEFGRVLIGGYSGKIRIGTNSNNVIFEGECDLFKDSDIDNKYLLKMKVYNYWIDKDGFLFVKVFRNDRLIDKYMKSKVNVEEKKEVASV